jgi:hypothetical protein
MKARCYKIPQYTFVCDMGHVEDKIVSSFDTKIIPCERCGKDAERIVAYDKDNVPNFKI